MAYITWTGTLVFLALLVTARASVCEDYVFKPTSRCAPNDDEMRLDVIDEDWTKICSLLQESRKCFKAAKDDCEAKGKAVDDGPLRTFETHVVRMYKNLCDGYDIGGSSGNTGGYDIGHIAGDGGNIDVNVGPQGAVCADYVFDDTSPCAPDKDINLNNVGQDWQNVCRKLQESIQCFEDAKADCEANGKQVDEEPFKIFKSEVQTIKYYNLCQGKSSAKTTDGTVTDGRADTEGTNSDDAESGQAKEKGKASQTITCLDSWKCHLQHDVKQSLLAQNQTYKACLISKASIDCKKSVRDACVRNQVLPESQLDQVREAFQRAHADYIKECRGVVHRPTALFLIALPAMTIFMTRLIRFI